MAAAAAVVMAAAAADAATTAVKTERLFAKRPLRRPFLLYGRRHFRYVGNQSLAGYDNKIRAQSPQTESTYG
jgi:hypothetical protein